MRDRTVIRRAQRLRKELTVAERKLWELIRNRQINGWRFRKQSDLAGYVVDFLCHDPKIVVELDGPHHDEPEKVEFDKKRDAEIEAKGFTVIRIDERVA